MNCQESYILMEEIRMQNLKKNLKKIQDAATNTVSRDCDKFAD